MLLALLIVIAVTASRIGRFKEVVVVDGRFDRRVTELSDSPKAKQEAAGRPARPGRARAHQHPGPHRERL